MISSYLKDKIILVHISIADDQSVTKTESDPIPARVENDNKKIAGQDGKEVFSNSLIIVNDDVTVKYTDRIRITELQGDPQTRASKEYAILKIHQAGGFGSSHVEISI